MLTSHLECGELRCYVATSYPIPLRDRPVYFDLGNYLRRFELAVPMAAIELELLVAVGYTLVWDGRSAREAGAPQRAEG